MLPKWEGPEGKTPALQLVAQWRLGKAMSMLPSERMTSRRCRFSVQQKSGGTNRHWDQLVLMVG
jgi:hypothetical protein